MLEPALAVHAAAESEDQRSAIGASDDEDEDEADDADGRTEQAQEEAPQAVEAGAASEPEVNRSPRPDRRRCRSSAATPSSRVGPSRPRRRKHGLLSADELRAIRERFGLTQAELARLLRLGANTVSRWESGRNVQTAAMDMLLRLIRDLPGSIDYLRDHHAA